MIINRSTDGTACRNERFRLDDMQAFAADLESLFTDMESLDPEMVIDVSRGSVTASAVVADEQMNRVLLQLVSVGNTHGVRFPRVFGIFIKQARFFAINNLHMLVSLSVVHA